MRDSIEEKFVKSIRYVAEDSSGNEDEKFQKNSLGVGSLRRDSTIFWDDYSMSLGEAADIKLLKELEAKLES